MSDNSRITNKQRLINLKVNTHRCESLNFTLVRFPFSSKLSLNYLLNSLGQSTQNQEVSSFAFSSVFNSTQMKRGVCKMSSHTHTLNQERGGGSERRESQQLFDKIN